MIVNVTQGDVLASDHTHIAYAVNMEGMNDAGFAGTVARFCGNGLLDVGQRRLGSCWTHGTQDRHYYALTCHTLKQHGWDNSPSYITSCLDEISLILGSDVLACVLLGAGSVGQVQGADVMANIGALARSSLSIHLWYLDRI